MAQESDPAPVARSVRQFLAREMTRRGLGLRECVEQLHADFELVCSEEQDAEALGSLEQAPEDYDDAWAREIERRRESLERGDARVVSFAELRARVDTFRQ